MSFKPLVHVLKQLESQATWQSQKRFWAILEAWPKVVGDLVSRQTKPITIHRDVLRVAVSSSVWAHNLTFERQRILEKLNDRLSLPLRDIRFSAGDWQPRSASPFSDRSQTQLLWQNHPSWAPATTAPQQQGTDKDAFPTDATPEAVFDQWMTLMQQRAKHLPLCPKCACPSPMGELQRWSVCGLCAMVKP